MSATYSGYRPPRCRIARPSAFSNGSSWRARSASFRTSERELWPVNGSLRGLAEPQEVPEDVGPELGVLNLRMELQSEQRPVAVPHRLDVAVLRARESHEVLGELRDFVVVGLPDLESIREPFEQDVGLVDLHDRLAELRHLGRGRVAPEILRHELVPRADPEDGSVERVEVLAVPPHLPGVHADAGRATRQHEPVEAIELRDSRVVRNDLRLDTEVLQDPPFAVGPLPPVVDDRLHWQEHGEVLPRQGHEPTARRGLDLFLDDGGRTSHERDAIRRHLPDRAHREARSGKRLPLRDPHSEGSSDRPNFVLVEVAERFDERQLHVLREAADVVVGLDPIPELPPALDPVRGDRPLDEMVGSKALCLSFEEFDERASNDRPFLLRVHDAFEGGEEFVGGLDDPVPDVELLEGLGDVLGLSSSHEACVDVDREEPIPEGATREDRRSRTIDPTGTCDDRLGRHGSTKRLDLLGDERVRVELHSPSVRESSRTHFFNASRCSLSFSTRRSSRRARISTARMAAFSPRSRPTAATGTPGGICETLRTASKFNLPLTGTPITGFVVCAAMVPGSAAESPAIAMITLAVVFRIKSRRRSGVRWAEATTMSYPTPNWSKNELACFPTSASLLEPSTMRTSTGIGWDKVGSWNKGFPLRQWNAASDLALHDGQEEQADGRGGSDDRREDHANRFDDDVDQVHGRAERTGVPRPQDTDDQTTYKQSDPDLPALPASKVRRESAGDDQEETEGQEEDGQERQPVKRGKAAHVIPQNLMPVKVFVSMTPGMDRILSTTT